MGHPVAGEQVLVLARDGALEAHHRVHPGGVLGLDEELRVGAVLAAAVGDPVVDDDDLAVVAQVDAPAQRPQQRVADGQRAGQAHAGRLHGAASARSGSSPRAQVVRHGAAGDAARRGAHQRLDHLAAVVVRQPDVEQQVDMVACASMSATMASMVALESASSGPLLPPMGAKPLMDWPTRNRCRACVPAPGLQRGGIRPGRPTGACAPAPRACARPGGGRY
jgi:hypothetical protein